MDDKILTAKGIEEIEEDEVKFSATPDLPDQVSE